jgi:hypothetical protein
MAEMPPGPSTLGAAVHRAEAERFVGRQRELARLHALWLACRARPVAVYLHGPRRIGKTALVRAFARQVQHAGGCVLEVSLDGAPVSPDEAVARLALQVGAARDPLRPPTPPELAAALNARARRQPVLLVVDGYDHLGLAEQRFRREVLLHLTAGHLVLLVGRRHPAELWPEEPAWLRTLDALALDVLEPDEAEALLVEMGVASPAARHQIVALSDGHPHLLGLAATLWHRQDGPAGAAAGGAPAREGGLRVTTFLERLITPNSRRWAWRAGVGHGDVDRLVAAAAILGPFDRRLLEAVAGEETVQAGWAAMTELPFVREVAPGRYALLPRVGQEFAGQVRRLRPWAERQWRLQALRHLTHLVREGTVDPGLAWEQVADLAREAPWHPWLHPDAPGVAVRAGWAEGDGATLRAAEGRGRHGAASESADGEPGHGVVAVDAAGRRLGYGRAVVLDDEGATGLGVPERLRAASGPVLALWTSEGPLEGAILRALLAHMARGHYPLVVARTSPSLAPALAALGFDADGVLRPGPGGLAGWLEARAFDRAVRPPEGRARLLAAKEALQTLDDPDRLRASAAARFFAQASRSPGATVRAWVLDCLLSADLNAGGVPARELLSLYYVQRVGSHERVAERLGLPRTTYFRFQRLALARFAEALFA